MQPHLTLHVAHRHDCRVGYGNQIGQRRQEKPSGKEEHSPVGDVTDATALERDPGPAKAHDAIADVHHKVYREL